MPDSHCCRLQGTGREVLAPPSDRGRWLRFMQVSNKDSGSVTLTVTLVRDGQDFEITDAVILATKNLWIWEGCLWLRPTDYVVAYLAAKPTTEPAGFASWD